MTLSAPAYRAAQWSTMVNTLIWLHGCTSVLDYGCGQGSLHDTLWLAERCQDLREYEPGVIGKDARPEGADLVVATEVLEHVEPDQIDAVLSHLRVLALKRLFTVMALTEVRPVAWWRVQFSAHGFALESEPTVKPSAQQWAAVWA